MPLHPQAKAFVDQIAMANTPAWYEMSPEEARRLFGTLTHLFGDGPELADVQDTILADIPVRIYRPSRSASAPVIVYFHGGGWVLGNLDTHDSLCRRFADAAASVVVAVDYHLAPEHRYPVAIEAAYRVVETIAASGQALGLDGSRMVVAGDSAGGNLAAAIALRSRDRQGPALRGQVLVYPVIEPDFESESYRAFATGHGLTRATMQWFWEQYIGAMTAVVPYANLGQTTLQDLPPAHVITAEYDVLRDEGESFAARLRESGVPTTSKRYNGMLHGFVHLGGIFDDSHVAVREIAAVIRQMHGF